VAMRTLYRTRYNIPVSDQPWALPCWQGIAVSWVLGCRLREGERSTRGKEGW